MSPLTHLTRRSHGFTIVEMIISTGVMAAAGLALFSALNGSMILFAKNTAVNMSHQEGRNAVRRLVRDIHAAVAIPQLINANFQAVETQPVNGSGIPTGTAGVSFQMVWKGPNYVFQDPGNTNLIMVSDGNQKPLPGMRLLVPHFQIESDILKASAAGVANHTNVFMVDAAEDRIRTKLQDGYFAVTYYTERVAYVVKNGELHLYKRRFLNGTTTPTWVDIATVARHVTSPTPFTVPLSASGTPDNRYIGVRLSTADPKSSARKFASSTTLLDTSIPYRSRIAILQ